MFIIKIYATISGDTLTDFIKVASEVIKKGYLIIIFLSLKYYGNLNDTRRIIIFLSDYGIERLREAFDQEMSLQVEYYL